MCIEQREHMQRLDAVAYSALDVTVDLAPKATVIGAGSVHHSVWGVIGNCEIP